MSTKNQAVVLWTLTLTDAIMGADAVPIAVVTGFWAVVGIILPFILGKGPNKGYVSKGALFRVGK